MIVPLCNIKDVALRKAAHDVLMQKPFDTCVACGYREFDVAVITMNQASIEGMVPIHFAVLVCDSCGWSSFFRIRSSIERNADE